jgi:hypothetical protein
MEPFRLGQETHFLEPVKMNVILQVDGPAQVIFLFFMVSPRRGWPGHFPAQ